MLNLNDQQAEDARQRIRAAMQALQERAALPSAIKQRAEAIARETHVSSKTLYRPENLELWHPEQGLDTLEPAETCKPPEPAEVSGSEERGEGETVRSLKRRDSEEVSTLEKSMKCEPLNAAFAPKNILSRGVRGDERCFPQEAMLSAPIPFEEVQAAIQAKVQALQWSLVQVRQFLAAHFQGRDRIWQLQAHELTTYLYYLQVEALACQ